MAARTLPHKHPRRGPVQRGTRRRGAVNSSDDDIPGVVARFPRHPVADEAEGKAGKAEAELVKFLVLSAVLACFQNICESKLKFLHFCVDT